MNHRKTETRYIIQYANNRVNYLQVANLLDRVLNKSKFLMRSLLK